MIYPFLESRARKNAMLKGMWTLPLSEASFHQTYKCQFISHPNPSVLVHSPSWSNWHTTQKRQISNE